MEVTPGDTIYMPAGTPHAARAQEELSGHLTVGIHVARWRDVIAGIVARNADALDGPVPAGWLEDPSAFAEGLGGRLAALASALGAVDVHAVTGERRERFLSTRATLARGTIAERATPITVDDGSVVTRRPDSICELVVKPDRLVASSGIDPSRCPSGWSRRCARSPGWATTRCSPCATWRSTSPMPASRAVLVRRLVREGVLTIVGEH